MRFLVWGAGAIGGTIGGHLARAAYPVTLVDKERKHVEAIRNEGLKITGSINPFSIRVKAFTPQELTGEYETVLLCVKAHHTDRAVRQMVPHLSADGFVVSVQNGLNESIIASMVGEGCTIGSFVNFDADYLKPGVIHYGGRGAVVIGELSGEITPRIQALHQSFLDFEPHASVSTNIQGYLWSKLAYGSMLFATALTHLPVSRALSMAEFRPLYIALMREVLAVAQSRSVTFESFDGFDPTAFLPGVDLRYAKDSLDAIAKRTGKSGQTHTGIWRDLAVRHRRTEVDSILGSVLAHAKDENIATPLLEKLIQFIHNIENSTRKQDISNLYELREELTSNPQNL